MKKGLYFLTFVLLMSSCTVNKKPVFVKVDHIKLISANAGLIVLHADAFLKTQTVLVVKLLPMPLK